MSNGLLEKACERAHVCSFVHGFGIGPGNDPEWRTRQVEAACEDNPANFNSVPYREAQPALGDGLALVLTANRKWKPGTEIKVHFMDGPEDARRAVIEYMNAWHRAGANIHFVREPNRQASMMRYTFTPGGSWSIMGNGCLGVPKDRPTAQLGWFVKQRRPGVVYHESGHGLALEHEQSHPRRECEYNRQAVISDMSGPPNNWSVNQIEFNIFRRSQSTNFTRYDRNSIMHYGEPASWFVDPACAVMPNEVISRGDKHGIRLWYPEAA
jgi:hypothetical protein